MAELSLIKVGSIWYPIGKDNQEVVVTKVENEDRRYGIVVHYTLTKTRFDEISKSPFTTTETGSYTERLFYSSFEQRDSVTGESIPTLGRTIAKEVTVVPDIGENSPKKLLEKAAAQLGKTPGQYKEDFQDGLEIHPVRYHVPELYSVLDAHYRLANDDEIMRKCTWSNSIKVDGNLYIKK